MLTEPAALPTEIAPDLANLVIVVAQTGDEWTITGKLADIGNPGYQNACNCSVARNPWMWHVVQRARISLKRSSERATETNQPGWSGLVCVVLRLLVRQRRPTLRCVSSRRRSQLCHTVTHRGLHWRILSNNARMTR